MRVILKIISLPVIIITWILYGVCRLLVLLSGIVLGIISGAVCVAAIVLFFKVGLIPGIAFLVIAFLISPYGIPRLAAWLTGKLGGISYALKDFVIS